jgi:signal transduction histidine kinase
MSASTRARWIRLGAQLALAFLVGLASFAIVAVVVAAAEPVPLAVLAGAACLAAVLAIARAWGVAYAVPAAMASLLAFDWYRFPPTHAHELPDASSVLNLLVYFAVACLIGELAANTARVRGELAAEQAALRRVATLVAREVPPADVFAAVAREVGELVGADATHMGRYEPGGAVVGVASWSRTGDELPAGTRAGLGSSVGVPVVVDGRLWGVMIASSESERRLPADTEARIAQFTDLVANSIANVQARSELAASRARIVAATDEERQRVVRDLHDGAQQRLVQTVLTLKLAQHAIEHDEPVNGYVADALEQAERATGELRELSHGILPAVLTRGGLSAAVKELGARMQVPVDVDVAVPRLAPPVEATAYFVVAEALTNVAKHAGPCRVTVSARVAHDALELRVQDDGAGGARPEGSGLLGLADRLAVLEGRLRVESPPGRGTVVAATIPLDSSAVPAGQRA